MDRDSALCKNRFRIMFFNIEILKTLIIPSSTVYNIIKRFRESGDICVKKGHSW